MSPRVKRDERILEAAVELFSERGFAGTGVDALGERAGIAGPAVYNHFSSKAELLATLIDQAMDHLLAVTPPANADLDPAAELEALVESYTQHTIADRRVVRIYLQEARSLTDADRRRTRRRQRQYIERWIDAISRLYPQRSELDCEVGARAAIGLIQSVINWPEAVVSQDRVEPLLKRMAMEAIHGLAQEDAPQPAAVR
jgi:AcrR family transcriptional regulator